MWNLKFPREVATPKRMAVQTVDEFNAFVKNNIASSDLFTTVYAHTHWPRNWRPDYNSAVIDRLYFDCDFKVKVDGEEVKVDGYENMVKLHEWCSKRNILHMCCHTGTAYNVILAVAKKDYKNKHGVVANSHDWLSDNLDIVTDRRVDLARLTRIPGTFNFKDKARRWVWTLNEEQIYLGHDKIRDLAITPPIGFHVLGSKAWNVEKFDGEPQNRGNIHVDEDNIAEVDATIRGTVPPCIEKLLATENLGVDGRYMLITWLRDNGYLLEEVVSIMEKHLSREKFIHSVYEEKQPQDLFKKSLYLNCYKCERIQKMKLCDHKKTNACGLRGSA
jgi:hypothetical protein